MPESMILSAIGWVSYDYVDENQSHGSSFYSSLCCNYA